MEKQTLHFDKIVIVAHPLEIGPQKWIEQGFEAIDSNQKSPTLYQKGNVLIAIMGIGGENAIKSLCTWAQKGYFKNSDVLLTGSAGSYTLPVLAKVQCPVPNFDNIRVVEDDAELVCVHEFISPENPHPELNAPDTCFDMESEFLINFCKELPKDSIKTLSIVKVISDNGDGSMDDWDIVTEKRVQPVVIEVVKKYIQ